MKLARTYSVLVITNIVVFSLFYIFVPALRDGLQEEDKFLGNITVIFFLGSFLLGITLIRRLKEKDYQILYFALPFLGLLGFLNEISLLDQFYRSFPEINDLIDALNSLIKPLNVKFIESRLPQLLLLAGFGVAYLLLIGITRSFQHRPRSLPFEFLIAVGFFLGIAALIDLGIKRHNFLFFLEELFEMNAALALLFASLAMQPAKSDPQMSPDAVDSLRDRFRRMLSRRQLIYLRDLLRELVNRDMKLRYKRSFLGLAWSLLNPLAQLLVLSFIFSLVLPLDIPNYPSFLFTGLLVWTWFQSSLFMATSAIVDNPELIRQPGFPAAVLPVVTVMSHLIHFLLALPILLLFLMLNGIQPTSAYLALPFVMVLQFLLTLSLAYFVATIHVTFRDTQYLLGIVLLLGFYLSPIFYDLEMIPVQYQLFYRLNPMVDLIDAYRAILMRGELPNYLPLLIIGLLAIGGLWLGHRLFTSTSYSFVEEL